MLADSYIAQGLAIGLPQLGGEVIIMSIAPSTALLLNETAAIIWLAADGKTRLRDIVECAVLEEFEVDREAALRDAENLVMELAGHGVLRIAAQPFALPGDKRA
jgi:hypothetical protein